MYNLILATVLLISAMVAAADPRVWGAEGKPVRNGHQFTTGVSATSSDGQTLLVWTDNQTGNGDLYAQLINDEGDFLWGDSARCLITLTENQAVHATIPVSSDFVIAYSEYGYDFSNSSDLFLTKIDIAGNVLWDQNEGRGVEIDGGSLPGSSIGNMYALPDGGLIVTQYDWDPWGEHFDYFIHRLDANGEAVWDEPVQVIENASLSESVHCDVDAFGNLYIARSTHSLQTCSTYLRKLSVDGVWLWDEIPVVEDLYGNGEISVMSDVSGGCYLAFAIGFTPDVRSIHLGRYDSDGVPIWPVARIVDSIWENSYGEIRIVEDFLGEQSQGVIVVWPENVAEYDSRLFAQKLSNTGDVQWQIDGVQLCDSGNIQSSNSFAFFSDGAGGLTASWQPHSWNGIYDLTPILMNRIDQFGSTAWGTTCGTELVSVARDPSFGSVSINNANRLISCWKEGTTPRTLRIQLTDIISGESLLADEGRILAEGLDGSASGVQAFTLEDGRCVLIWQDSRAYGGDPRGLYFQAIDQHGCQSLQEHGRPLFRNPEDEQGRVVSYDFCSDGAGGFFMAYKLDQGFHEDEIRIIRLDSNLEFVGNSQGLLLEPNAGEYGSDHEPRCVEDGEGGAIVIWSNNDPEYPLYDARMMRVDASLTPMWEQPLWPTQNYHLGSIVPLPGGACVLISGASGLLRLTRVNSNGYTSWVSNPSSETGGSYSAVSDSQGNVFVVWEDRRTGNSDSSMIYIQGYDAEGNQLGPDDGVRVAFEYYPLENPRLYINEDRDMFVIAEVETGFLEYEEYIQKVSSELESLWSEEGIALFSEVAEGQRFGDALPDADGGILVTWTNSEAAPGGHGYFREIWGKHLNASGFPADEYWEGSLGGVICDVNHSQSSPILTRGADAGEFYCIWRDGRVSSGQLWMNYLDEDTVTAVDEPVVPIPHAYFLGQNYPNPFNSQTEIRFAIAKAGEVKLVLYDLLGRQVRTIRNNVMQAGEFTIAIDAVGLPSGVYFYKLISGDFQAARKMVLIR